ncbi:MAG: VWA domain-containing protein [Gemmataceae bacterium]|nr:VWA domain-containing protein [Gemmataceae bacterium]
MPDAFRLKWKLDRPFLEPGKPEDVHVLLTVEPDTASGVGAAAQLPVHLLLLVDVSGSMDFLVRHDPNAQKIGDGFTEGHATQRVVSNVPSRREMACAVVQKLAERLGPDDMISLVAFDDYPHVLLQHVSPMAADVVLNALRTLGTVGGGGTSLGKGLAAIRVLLTNHDDGQRTRKLVVLTDGEDEDPGQALVEAQTLGQQYNLPIVAFGTGECKVAFLTEIARTNLAGGFNHIRHETDAEQYFFQVLQGQKNIQATNVTLTLWLSPELHVRELYRTRPEILFVGSLEPDANNQVVLRLEQMEHGKAYEFLFRCSLPARAANQRFRIAKATLRYDLPAAGKLQQAVETNIVVEYTADPARAQERSGDVKRVLARAEVQRQVLFLQTKIDAVQQNRATDRDRAIIAKLLAALVQKFQEFGDQAVANQYRAMQAEFLRKGTISQEMLNRSLAASSRAEELVVAQDIDF